MATLGRTDGIEMAFMGTEMASGDNREISVDSIRDDLRGALVHVNLHLGMQLMMENPANIETVRDTMRNMAAFGVNSRLFSMEEFSGWEKVIEDGIILHVKQYIFDKHTEKHEKEIT